MATPERAQAPNRGYAAEPEHERDTTYRFASGVEVDLPGQARIADYVTRHRDDIWKVASIYARSEAVPYKYRDKTADVFTILTTGLELGLGYATALRTIDVKPRARTG